MGVPFSCLGSDYDDIDRLEAFTVRSISFKSEDVSSIIRTLSFKDSDRESSVLKSYGSGKMIIEGSLSFKRSKMDQFQVETTFSIQNSPSKNQDFNRLPSFKDSKCKSFDEKEGLSTDIEAFVAPEFSDEHASCKEEDSLRNSQEETPKPSVCDPNSPKHEAALKLQKVYKSFRTRRQLADCAVLVEQSWWKLLDFALLKHSSVSFFDVGKPESAVSRWSRARTRAAKVGKGLSKDKKARKLALQHWLEAIDPRHRYGHNLHLYYIYWLHCESRQPFFYWLDIGDGKEVNHEHCPRWKLQQQCIKYLGPKEREIYEVVVKDGRFIYKHNERLVDTYEGNDGSKWIFVLSTSKSLYVGQKKKGKFQHSSFLAGAATSSAGRLVVEKGILKAIWPHSGHYRPTEENFLEFLRFLEENNMDLTNVKRSPTEDDEKWSRISSTSFRSKSYRSASTRDTILSDTTGNLNEEQHVELHCHASTTTSPKSLNDHPSLDLEEKTDHSPAKHNVSNVKLEGESSPNDIHGRHLFRGSDEESDEEIEIDNLSRNTKITTRSISLESFDRQDIDRRSLLDGKLERNASWQFPASSNYMFCKRNLFEEEKDEDQEPPIVPPEVIFKRINSMKGTRPNQLRKQSSSNWTTGTGPRISCVRDYPSELQFRALEQVNLSPRSAVNSRITAVSSPKTTATTRLQSF